MSLLLVEAFAEVVNVNTEALNIKSCQPRQKHCRRKAEAKCIFTSAFYLPRQKMLKFEGCNFSQLRILAKPKLYCLLITLERVKQKTIFLSLISWTRTGLNSPKTPVSILFSLKCRSIVCIIFNNTLLAKKNINFLLNIDYLRNIVSFLWRSIVSFLWRFGLAKQSSTQNDMVFHV